MSQYLLHRLQHLFWVLLAVSILVFLLVYLSGDPFASWLRWMPSRRMWSVFASSMD